MVILPSAQKRLWPELRNAPNQGFTLYGGTAIALRLGHRDSVDFDFFSEKPLDREAIKAAFPFMEQSTTLQDHDNTWVVLVPYGNSEREHVKVSFFGTIAFGRVGEPDFTDDGVLQVASFDDLMATKVKVVLQRAEAKDYRDVAAMVNVGVSLSHGLASARQLYGPNFQPSESLKALVYFNDGDLKTLTADEKKTLVDAVKAVRNLPDIALRSTSLSGLSWKDLSVMDERIGNLAMLENRAGAAFTFWQRATAAIKAHGADAVNWGDVEQKTIIESISENGQPPSDVADVICQHSPGVVQKARQEEVRALVEKLAPELQAQYAKARGEKGCEP
ncbi:MAG: Nucleotidyl transferase AbiEii toxin, Type IV TA system [Glomeribacter sp. 1016415]|nr:Nucleotidyl transferase AbiEii toxin, Type IV TA system [Glomeribacter sp. 1016415]